MSDTAAELTPNDKVPHSHFDKKAKSQVSATDKLITVLIYRLFSLYALSLCLSFLLDHH